MAKLDTTEGIGMGSPEGKVLMQSIGAEMLRLNDELSALHWRARAELDSSDALRAPIHDADRQAPLAPVTEVTIKKVEARIKGLEAAIIKIDKGEYGLCEDCGEDIPLRRLEVIGLETRLCAPCQGDLEVVDKRGQTKPDRGGIALSPPLRR